MAATAAVVAVAGVLETAAWADAAEQAESRPVVDCCLSAAACALQVGGVQQQEHHTRPHSRGKRQEPAAAGRLGVGSCWRGDGVAGRQQVREVVGGRRRGEEVAAAAAARGDKLLAGGAES